jgi:hypothetical protein
MFTRRAVLVLFALALLGVGCNGSSGRYGYDASYYPVPAPQGPSLLVQVTNNTSATIDVTATTPDETVDGGTACPGETIQFDLGELPPYADLAATAVTADATGCVPTYPDFTVNQGVDYTADGFVGVEWDDCLAAYDTLGGPAGHTGLVVVKKANRASNARRVIPTRRPR